MIKPTIYEQIFAVQSLVDITSTPLKTLKAQNLIEHDVESLLERASWAIQSLKFLSRPDVQDLILRGRQS